MEGLKVTVRMLWLDCQVKRSKLEGYIIRMNGIVHKRRHRCTFFFFIFPVDCARNLKGPENRIHWPQFPKLTHTDGGVDRPHPIFLYTGPKYITNREKPIVTDILHQQVSSPRQDGPVTDRPRGGTGISLCEFKKDRKYFCLLRGKNYRILTHFPLLMSAGQASSSTLVTR